MTGKTRSRIGAIELPVHRLHVELTNRCNFSCEFCPDRSMRRPRGSMPLWMVEHVLADAGRGGIARQVHFHVMGEPLCSPLLPAAVGFARRHGMEAWVTTNGSLLTPSLLTELQAAGLSHLTISLQTPDAPTFARRGSGLLSFDQYREGLIGTLRAFLARPSGLHLSICFLSNPLRRFHAPGASSIRVAESGRELRAHMGRWVERIFAGTALEPQIPALLPRLK
ncbi:MAG TPA: radical SAM protein, partial [Candidatus Acidoferrum sp.]|nr:radical SAM protein [Candidatus Acidoferrum sp.]